LLLAAALGCTQEEAPTVPLPRAPRIHPVFHTLITGSSARRPAIQVDVLDASESWFGTAELYLAVQNSSVPDSPWTILPINVGDFNGCRTRFVQLPFEVSPGDNLAFNLLDDDELSAADEQRIITGCRLTGYCVLASGALYAPNAAKLIHPVMPDIADALGDAVVSSFSLAKFENLGQETYITPQSLPRQPNEANRLSLLNDSHYARVQLRIYGPETPLAFQAAESAGLH
jgi:hypothetical protein